MSVLLNTVDFCTQYNLPVNTIITVTETPPVETNHQGADSLIRTSRDMEELQEANKRMKTASNGEPDPIDATAMVSANLDLGVWAANYSTKRKEADKVDEDLNVLISTLAEDLRKCEGTNPCEAITPIGAFTRRLHSVNKQATTAIYDEVMRDLVTPDQYTQIHDRIREIVRAEQKRADNSDKKSVQLVYVPKGEGGIKKQTHAVKKSALKA